MTEIYGKSFQVMKKEAITINNRRYVYISYTRAFNRYLWKGSNVVKNNAEIYCCIENKILSIMFNDFRDTVLLNRILYSAEIAR
jgi:hypothetical protein